MTELVTFFSLSLSLSLGHTHHVKILNRSVQTKYAEKDKKAECDGHNQQK